MRLLEIVLAVLAALAALEFILRLRERRREAEPARPAAPDWSACRDYMDLSEASAKAGWLTPDEFLDGPFRRYLELGAEPGTHPRVRARAMEFCRHAILTRRDRLAEQGGDAEAFERKARAMAASCFARPEVENGDYMMEVFEGISNHNGRSTVQDSGQAYQ